MLRTKKEVDRHVRELLNKTKNEDDRRARGYNIARLYVNVGEYECARRYVAEFLSFRPKSPEAHKLLGQIYEKLGQKERAVYSFKTSYSISDTQRELVPKICELYAELDTDLGTCSYWADEGERLFPHHNSVVKLKQSMMVANPSQSKEEVEKFYLGELKANPLSLSLHVKLAKHYINWGKEQKDKFDEAFNYVRRVEIRRPFPHSLEWYQTMVEVFKVYENWKKPKDDKAFEELYLTILDRYVFESIASSCGPALSAVCSPKEAAMRLQEFDERLVQTLKILDRDSDYAHHLIAQYYFHFALLLAIIGKTESILHKDIYMGCLLLHSCFLPNKLSKPSFSSEDKGEIFKAHLFTQGHYRVSQAGHLLNKLAQVYRGQKYFISKVQELCNNEESKKHLHKLVFDLPQDVTANSYLLLDKSYLKGELAVIDENTQYLYDQELCLSCNHDLRELVWLFIQYSSLNSPKTSTKFLNFLFFRRISFSSSMTTFAPETLCHLDLIAFIVAAAYCHQINTDSYVEAETSCPSILAVYLHTPEQGEWWNAVSALCTNTGNKRLNRLRSILQNGLESIRHLGHHILPLQVTVHLARYFTSSIQEARDEGNSASEVEALEERAEHYWSKVVSQIFKSYKGIHGPAMKSRLFEIRRCELSESELNDIGEEGELFIADRMVQKGKRDEAIQILARLKSPKAAFNRAMLYKKEAQSLLGNRTWYSLNVSTRNEYTSLLTQTRDALYLTLDRLKMPGVDPSDPLNLVLSDELTSIEHSLATVTMDDYSDNEPIETLTANPNLNLTNGNTSMPDAWGGQTFGLANSMFSTPISSSRIQRQEARPSPERLDAQVRHLTEIQQNTIKNIEEHNAALRAQNNALLQTCQTMAAEFKENVAFYKSYIEQKNASTNLMNPVLDQMKQLQLAIRNLQLDVRTISTEITELKSMRFSQSKAEPLHHVTAGTNASDNQVPLDIASPAMQGVYNNYIGFYGQQPVGSPLVTPAIFNPCQPPFMPPSTLQDQTYLPSASATMKSEHASILTATTLYQHGLKVAQSKLDKELGATTVPPHSYQIPLPTSSVITFPNMPQSFSPASTSEHTFNTEGLLSSVPAPLYSAITTYQSPERGNKNLLASSLTSTPVTHKINLKGDSSYSPTFGQWPNSGADFPGTSTKPVGTPGDIRGSLNKSANESERYVDDEHDPCPDFKPIIPLPEQVEVNTGEESEKVLFEGRAKLFRFVDKEWKERGLGPLKILHNENQNTVRVLMRRDQTHKICCNHLITSTMELTPMKENDKAWLWAAQDFADEKLTLEKFCCKFKTGECAQDFQKAFYKGKMVAEAAEQIRKTSPVKEAEGRSSSNLPSTTITTTTTATITTTSKTVESTPKPELKSLQEMFKPEEGSWSCPTCLVKNKREVTACVACQTHKPGETSVKLSSDLTSASKETPKATFRFGASISTPSTSPNTTLTFLQDKSGTNTGLSFGTPVSKQDIMFETPVSSGTVPSSPTVFSTPGGTTVTFGPNSSVTINALKPGSTPISLFKSSSPVPPPAAIVISSDSLAENVDASKNGEGKFSVEGFTFSSQPNLSPPKSATTVEAKSVDKIESKKESIFSNFTFSSSKPAQDTKTKSSFLFDVPASSATSTSTTLISETITNSSQPSGGLLWSTKNTDNAFSFSSLAATGKPDGKLLFATKDPQAFEPKPLFGKSGATEAKKNESVVSNISKDDIEEYEPQVDFKPVVPLPELVDTKTGEEEEEQLFCERTKLYRYDADNKEWKERGVGDAKLLRNTSSAKVRFLMRRDQTHKVCANHFVTKDMLLSVMFNSDKAWVWAAHDYADEEMKLEKFAIRFKTVELAQKFKIAFEDAQKNLSSVVQKDDLEKSSASVSVEDTATSTTDDVSKPKDIMPLSELFKPATGSWECSECLIRNSPDTTICMACSTTKDGVSADSNAQKASVFGNSSYLFKSNSSGSTFTFGVPSTSASSGTSTGFKFGTTITTDTSLTTTSVTTKPMVFTWKPPTSTTTATTPTTTSAVSVVTATPTKSSTSTSSGFTFGSPGKYKFEFSGVRSPRSRDTSTCESEGAEEEEEEDNLYFEPVVPLPEKVDVVTGEEDETSLYSHRAKLFRIKDGEFKERGLGDIKILEHKVNGKIRLLMRREQVHKVCLNHYVAKDLQFIHKDEKSLCWIATDFSEQDPAKETFAIRFKNAEITKSFLTAIHDAQVKLGKVAAVPSDINVTLDNSATLSSTTAVTESKTSTSVDKPQTFGVFGKSIAADTSKTTFSFGDKINPKAEGIEVVYERKATTAQIEEAKKLLLPDNFYLYEDNKPCPGCIGCSPDDFVFKKIEKDQLISDDSSTQSNIFDELKSIASSTLFQPKISDAQPTSPTTNVFGGVSSFASEGTNQKKDSANIFGSGLSSTKSIFGETAPTGSIFGGTAPTGSIFGGTAPTGSIFGGTPPGNVVSTPTTKNIFGGTPPENVVSTPTTKSIFGGTPTAGSIFGGDLATKGSIFGGTSFGSTSSPVPSSNIFGGNKSNETSSSSLFGSVQPVTTTEVTTTSNIFGDAPTGTTTSSNIFGSSLPASTVASSVFDSSLSATTTASSIFGSSLSATTTASSIFGSSLATTTASSVFGSNPSVITTTSSIFDNTQSTKFSFGSLKTSTDLVDPQKPDSSSVFVSSAAGALSFGDIAKQTPSTTFKSTPKNPSVWVSKPLFASDAKSPAKDTAEGDDEYDPHYEPVIPMPELITVKTGEEGWSELFCHRAKLYRYDAVTKEWKERGLGDFKIQYEPSLNKYRFLQRREQVHKLSCNHFITPSLTLDPMASSETAWCWVGKDYSEKPEGELLKLAVRFKTKEIATDFKTAFENCHEKVVAASSSSTSIPEPEELSEKQGEHQTFAEVSSASSSFVVIEKPQFQQMRDTEETDDADEYEDVSGSEETVDDEEEGEGETDEEEQTLIFTEKCHLSFKIDQEWQLAGSCELKVAYDDEAFGARIVATSVEGEKLVDHLIAVQTTIYNEDDQSVSWTFLDETAEQPKKVEVKATFENDDLLRRFELAYEEGKDYAYNSGIEETCYNEVPEELLYYGQASED